MQVIDSMVLCQASQPGPCHVYMSTNKPIELNEPPLSERQRLVQDAIRADGWVNLVTSIGVIGKDNRLAGSFANQEFLPPEACEALYQANPLAARIIEQLAEDSLREGWKLHVEDDPDAASEVENLADQLELNEAIIEAQCNARAYGGGAVLLGVKDGARSLAEPLDPTRLESVEFVTPFSCRELEPVAWYTDPMAPDYGRPSLFQIRDEGMSSGQVVQLSDYRRRRGTVLIHESRLLVFDGVRAGKKGKLANNGWGASVLQRVHESLRNHGQGWAAAAVLVQNFAYGVWKMKGLAEALAMKEAGEAKIRARVSIANYTRSMLNCLLVDGEVDDYEIKTVSVAGLDAVLNLMVLDVAAAANMPISILMGQAPSGLSGNAVAGNDIRNWYDRVSGWQKRMLRPRLNRFIEAVFLSSDGPTNGKEPEKWRVSFNPLWQPTDAETAQVRSQMASADVAYINAQVLTPEEVAMSRFGGDSYSLNTVLDLEARDAYARELEQAPEEAPPPGDSSVNLPTNANTNGGPDAVAAQAARSTPP